MKTFKDGKLIEFIPTQSKPERDPTFKEFLEILNPGRKERGLKEVTYGRLGVMLQHLDSWDRKLFLANCKDAPNPAACFWSKLKIDKK